MTRPVSPPALILRRSAGYTGWMLLAGLLSFLTIGSSIGLLMSSAYIIARAALHPSIAELQIAIVGVRFFGISRGVFRYLERLVSHDVTFRLLADLRVWFYQRLEPLVPAATLSHHSGDLLSRVTADIETLQHLFIRIVSPPAVALAVGLLMSGILLAIDPPAAALFAACYLAAAAPLPLLTRALSRPVAGRIASAQAGLRVAALDFIAGLPELQVLGRDTDTLEHLDTRSRALIRDQQRLARLNGLHEGAIGVLMNLAVIALLLRLIPAVEAQTLSGVTLTVAVLGVMAAFEAVQPLPAAAQVADECREAATRLADLTQARPPVHEPPHPAPLPDSADLRIRDLTFHYPGTPAPVLQGLDLHLPPGGRLAVVGPSGAGKSTLAHLLLRFWDPSEGHIQWGGQDIRSASADALRARIGFVAQDTHLFTGTLRSNLLLAAPRASEAGQRTAIERAGLLERWQADPDAEIGEQGLQLSGGERQRLALARALLREAPLLLLDEPTAHLDPERERDLLHTFLSLPRDRSLLLITHRLTGLDAMDEILVLDHGRPVERGTHDQLLRRNGLYAKLHALQREQTLLETRLPP